MVDLEGLVNMPWDENIAHRRWESWQLGLALPRRCSRIHAADLRDFMKRSRFIAEDRSGCSSDHTSFHGPFLAVYLDLSLVESLC
jgi:hypothetical protein